MGHLGVPGAGVRWRSGGPAGLGVISCGAFWELKSETHYYLWMFIYY